MRERALREITKKFKKIPKKFPFVRNGEIGPMRKRALREITKKIKTKIPFVHNLSEGPKIFRGTDLNSTLVVTLPSKPQRRPTIILRVLILLDPSVRMSYSFAMYNLYEKPENRRI